MSTLSSRGHRAVKPSLPYLDKFLAALRDQHSPTNPDGYVLMAVAENRLNFQSALAKLESCRVVDSSTGAYDNFLGRSRFRAALADVFSLTLLSPGRAIDADQLCVSSGCGALLNNLALTLLEPGDGVLLPTPTYAALYNDLVTIAEGHIIDMPTEATGYAITEALLEAGWSAGCASGHTPRMMVLINPGNPLGNIFSRQEVALCMKWCTTRSIHLVLDEIYANSVHSPDASPHPFASGVEIAWDGEAAAGSSRKRTPTPVAACGSTAEEEGPAGTHAPTSTSSRASFLGDYVHVLWGLSKDWCMGGYRVGVLYTHNADLLTAMANLNYFCGVSNDTQDCLATMLEDRRWCTDFLAANQLCLREAYLQVTAMLTTAGLAYHPAPAGMFVWIDLSAYLTGYEGEESVASSTSATNSSRASSSGCAPRAASWEDELALTEDLFQHCKILFTPGQACHAATPGFARCCFARVSHDSLRVGIQRLVEWAATHRKPRPKSESSSAGASVHT